MEKYLGLPPLASAQGGEIDHSIVVIHWLMLALFAGWIIFYIITLVRFRASKNPRANYRGAKSKFALYLTGAVAVFELTTLFGIDAPIWARRVNEFPLEKDAIVVRIVAEQFAWNIHYPGPDGKFGKASINLVDQDNPLGLDRNDPDAKDDITTINQLCLPVNKPVIIHLTSKDVIHCFNLPTMRVKQDVVPGMDIPVWFTPTKTTAQVREELRKPYSISKLMESTTRIVLPTVGDIVISKGGDFTKYIVMKDCADSSGASLVTKGSALDKDNAGKLVDAGITTVTARMAANLDKYVSASEYKDPKDTTGGILVGKGDPLNEDAVTKLTDSGVKTVTARPLAGIDNYVAMETYNDKSGAAIVNKGDPMSDQVICKLADADVREILIAPATPTEIACAQLCGLGHFRMRGYINVVTQEEFDKWVADQEAALAPPPSSADSTASMAERGTH